MTAVLLAVLKAVPHLLDDDIRGRRNRVAAELRGGVMRRIGGHHDTGQGLAAGRKPTEVDRFRVECQQV